MFGSAISLTKSVEVLYCKNSIRQRYGTQFLIKKEGLEQGISSRSTSSGVPEIEIHKAPDIETPDETAQARPRPRSAKKPEIDVEAIKHIKLPINNVQLYHVNNNMRQGSPSDIQSVHEWGWAKTEETMQDIKHQMDNLETHMQSYEILRAEVAGEPSTTLRILPGFHNHIKTLCASTEDKLEILRDVITTTKHVNDARHPRGPTMSERNRPPHNAKG